MIIAGMAKSSLVDYPGLISCVLFVPGCGYDCFYCHNRALIDGSHSVIDAQYVEDFLKKRAGLLDAVVITGGEPTLQPDLIPYIESVKQLGYRIKLDTNGASPSVVAKLLQTGLCDYFAVDYKAPSARYKEIARGTANAAKVLETIRLLSESQVAFEVRTTVFPQLTESDLVTMAQELPVLPRYVLNAYRKPEKFRPCDNEMVNQTPYTPEQIKKLADLIRVYQPNVSA